MSEMSPMMVQYMEIKKQNSDKILMFRLGDFYEMFFEDAQIASRVLELTLTGRAMGNGEKAPMCGVPFHSADNYISRLIAAGYKVAICEQLEDPKQTKGIVKRDIVRVLTKGSVVEGQMLDESKNNYLTSIFLCADKCAVAFIDVSTGVLNLTSFEGKTKEKFIINELGTFVPSEIIMNPETANNPKISSFINTRIQASCEILKHDELDYEENLAECQNHFGSQKLASLGINDDREIIICIGAALKYLKYLYKADVMNITEINVYSSNQFMRLDYSTKRNLEIIETMRKSEKKGSLLWVLDKTKTAMGKRLLRSWLENPLTNYAQITRRLNATQELIQNSIKLSEIRETLSGMLDAERLISRVVIGTANAKDLNALRQTIEYIPSLKFLLESFSGAMLKNCHAQLDELQDIYGLISSAIDPDAPFSLRDGGIIKAGFNRELDELNLIQRDGKRFFSEIEAREREKTGIPKLKIGYNRVFGYYIEVTNSYKDLVPDSYIRKQTLTNGERYITQELKELESKVLGANERSTRLEYEIFVQIRNKVAESCTRLQLTAKAIAIVDVLCSFALCAVENNYCCPVLTDKSIIDIKEGRHPVVEKVLSGAPFVPNDTYLDTDDNRTAIITGPNMAGKSTYMRQVALICLMAQIGSFVPAKSATLGVVDSIFTRVGASDDLMSGQSTFMVEMNEVSNILKSATKNSLIILDEVGRGTSTFDGMSIARSCLEYITDKKKIGAKTLFSTHYHELTELEGIVDGVKNYNICVKKRGDSIVFLRRIVRGKADGSYGIEVAKLAGLPPTVVKNARQILLELESGVPASAFSGGEVELDDEQMPVRISLSSNLDDEIINFLKNIDTDTLTPLEALTTLTDLASKARSNGEF